MGQGFPDRRFRGRPGPPCSPPSPRARSAWRGWQRGRTGRVWLDAGRGGSASGILALHVTFGNRVREAAETRLEPHGGRRARGQCPLPTCLGVQTLGFAVGTGDLIGALQRSPPFWMFPRIRVFSGPKTRKSHLLQKPKESEAQRPSLLTRP